MDGILTIGLIIVIALLLGVIAFFQSLAARDEIVRLRNEIDSLNRRLAAMERRRDMAPSPAAVEVEPARPPGPSQSPRAPAPR